MTGDVRGQARPWSVVPVAFSLLLLAAASTEWKGYRFGGSNHSIQVPLVKHLVDPGAYAGDPLLSSFDGYPTFFFHGLAAVVRAVGHLELLYFILYLACHWAALCAVHALTTLLFRSPAVSAVACFLYLGQVAGLGAELTYWPRLTHAQVATAVLLWAVYLHLRGKHRWAFALCGVAFNLHALYALHVITLLGADGLLRLRDRGLRPLATDLALGTLLALPAILWILSRHDPITAGDWPIWLATLRERSALHAFPLAVPGAVYARYLLLLSLAAISLPMGPGGDAHRTVRHIALATVSLCLLGLVFAEWLPVRPVIEAQLLRSTKWLTVLALAYGAQLLVASWAWGGLARTAAVLCLAGILLQQPAWLALGLALYLVGQTRRLSVGGLVAAGSALFLAALTGAAPLPDRLGLASVVDALARVLESPAVVACLVGFLLLRVAGFGRMSWSAAVLLLLGGYVLPRMYRDHRAAMGVEPWSQVQAWVRDHTPRDAVVLTPPHREGFRVLSERAIVGEWKDGTQQFFSWAFTREWRRRMDDLGGGSTPAYDGLPVERLAAVARRYRAEWVVFAADRPLPFPKVFETEEHVVYRLPPEAGSGPPR